MGNDEPLFFFDLPQNGGSYEFRSHDAIADFITKQVEQWSWLGAPEIVNDATLQYVRNVVVHQITELSAQLTHWRQDERLKNGFIEAFRQTFSLLKLPVEGTPAAQFLDDLREDRGDKIAAAALAALTGMIENMKFNDPIIFRGVVAAYLFEEGLSDKAASASKKALDDAVAQSFTSLRTITSEAKKRSDEARKARDEFAHRSVSLLRRALQLARVYRARQRAEHETAVADINRVKTTYEEMLQIKAPVEYWEKKAEEHRGRAGSYCDILLRYAVISGAVLLGAMWFILNKALDVAKAPDTPPALFIILGAIGVVVVTVVFWAARILVRLFMSEHHLAIDASERATMAMTYLALTEVKAAEEKDRAIVLAALFRPTTDGIVKDDAAPDLGPASLLSKVLEKK